MDLFLKEEKNEMMKNHNFMELQLPKAAIDNYY